MKDKPLRALIVDDSEDDVLLIIRELKKGGYDPVYERVETAATMEKSLKDKPWDIILCDYKMPNFSAPSAIALLKETSIDIPIIIISGAIGEETAVECMRLGARDYIMKGNFHRLCPAIERELEEAKVRKKKNQAEKERSRLTAIMENTTDLIATALPDGQVTYINKAGRRMLGMGVDEDLRGFKISDAHPAWARLVVQNKGIPDAVRNGVWHGETALSGRDGLEIPVSQVILIHYSPDGNVDYMSTIMRDISERKHTEEALRASEELYTKLVNAIPDIIVRTDLAGNIFFVNDYALQMSGYSREEIVGKNLLTFISPENHEDVINNLLLMTQARLGPREYNLIIKDGKKIPIEVNGDVLRNEDGTPFGLVNVCRDIRERKRAEESLHAWMRRYDLIVEASGEIAYEYTISTGDVVWGRSIENVLGYSQDEISGGFTQWQDLLHPDDRPSTLDLLSAAEKTCSYWDVQYRMRHHNGHYIWIRDRGFFLPDSDGRAYCQLGMLDDVTEHRLAEEKLQQTLESFKNAVGTTIQVLISALEARDPYTSGHQSRTAHLACAIATEMGFSQDKIEGIRMAGSIHDIGKLSIPAEILVKPTKLSDLEYSLIKEHAKAGYEMLKDVESPWPLAEVVHQHHERMNGSGYPGNLKGDEIIPEARIMAVADVVEAMASHRPYRAALGIEIALEEIEKNKGILYDDAVVDTCLKLFREKGYQLLTVKS